MKPTVFLVMVKAFLKHGTKQDEKFEHGVINLLKNGSMGLSSEGES